MNIEDENRKIISMAKEARGSNRVIMRSEPSDYIRGSVDHNLVAHARHMRMINGEPSSISLMRNLARVRKYVRLDPNWKITINAEKK